MYRTALNGALRPILIGETFYSNKPKYLMRIGKMFSNKMKSQESLTMKPPNVLIFNNQETKNSHFEEIASKLTSCLSSDSYTIYQLTPSQIVQSFPWKENCVLLIIYSSSLSNEARESFRNFFETGGSILSICSDLNLPNVNVQKLEKPQEISSLEYENETYHIESASLDSRLSIGSLENVNIIARDSNQRPVIVEIISEKSHAVISLVNVTEFVEVLKRIFEKRFKLRIRNEDESIPNISTVYLTTKDLWDMKKINRYVTQKERKISLTHSTLLFERNRNLSGSFGNAEYNVTMLKENSNENLSFDVKKYFKILKTRVIGNTVMFAEVVNSTMDLVDGFSPNFGVVAIAKVQIGGKGRGGNKWLSPPGCAMFTYQLSIPLNSRLGQTISFVQHLTTLAIVHSVRKQPGYQDLDLNIKWPNDVYCANKYKLGGVLVNSILYSDTVICYVGCGINLNNKHPTICVNSIIEESNRVCGTNLETLSTEWFVASVLNCLEELIDDFQTEGPSSCLPLYYRYWIHEGQELKLGDSGKTVVVEGLDEYGYLSVVSNDEGRNKKMSLQPDGNGLDMMKNLLILK